MLHVSDLRIPEGVTLVTDPSEPIARVQQPRIEEEVVVAPAEGEAAAAEGGEEGAGESTEGSSES